MLSIAALIAQAILDLMRILASCVLTPIAVVRSMYDTSLDVIEISDRVARVLMMRRCAPNRGIKCVVKAMVGCQKGASESSVHNPRAGEIVTARLTQ